MAVLALDLGGTKLASALVSEKGEILIAETAYLKEKEAGETGKFILQKANHILQQSLQKKIPVTALGICVPGIAHTKTGTVWAPNIPGWDDYPLLQELEKGIADKNISIKIDSDRACYILGETWKGNATECSDAIFLSIGTGIGAGILVNNEVVRGSHGIAGALGWMALHKPFEKKYYTCGCFEYNTSGEGLVKVARELSLQKKFAASCLSAKGKELTAKDIFSAYELHDTLATEVLNQAIEYWGMAVANLVSIFNPEKIIFGGGVFGPALKFLNDIYDEAKKWAQPISMQHVRLEASALGNKAGLYGAAYLVLK